MGIQIGMTVKPNRVCMSYLRVPVAESKQVQAGRADSLKPNFGVLRRHGTLGKQI